MLPEPDNYYDYFYNSLMTDRGISRTRSLQVLFHHASSGNVMIDVTIKHW